jgi:uncharacterized protein (DUF2267 family)
MAMKYDEFISAFAERAGVAGEEAESLIRAGLEALAERITGGEARDLAAQLPKSLQEPLKGKPEPAEDFGPEEFIRRISDRTGVDTDRAELAMRALFATLRQATTGGEFNDVMSQLPREYRERVPPTSWRGGPLPD